MSIIDQVLQVSPARASKGDVIEWFKSEYPGSRTDKAGRTIEAWRGHAAEAYAKVTGLSRASALREFQGKRAGGSGRKNAEVWREIGQDLPPRVPDGGYHITGTVYVKFSDGECEEREVDETITGSDARALLAMGLDQADEVAYQAIVNHYMEEDFDEEEPTASIGSCQEPRLTVSPIE